MLKMGESIQVGDVHYTVQRELGSGRFGSVWLGLDMTAPANKVIREHQARYRAAALKVLKRDSDFDFSEAVNHGLRCRSELPPDLSISNSLAPKLISHGAVEIACTEFIEGPMVRTIIGQLRRAQDSELEDRRLEEALLLGKRLMEMAGELLDAGVIHSDMNPRNIVVTPAGKPKAVDIDFLRRVTDMPIKKNGVPVRIGSERYISPEVKDGPGYSRVSDLYAISGIVRDLVNVAAGRSLRDASLMFGRRDLQALISYFPSSLQERFFGLIQCVVEGLNPIPEKRPQNSTEIRDLMHQEALRTSEPAPALKVS